MSLKDLFNKAKEAAVKQERANLSSSGPGRMSKTDVIKGPDCKIPNSPGTYRHRDKETGKIVYIGDTQNLKKRQQEHARNGKLDTSKQYVEYSKSKEDATREERRQTEKDHIKRHNPSGNKTQGGNGR